MATENISGKSRAHIPVFKSVHTNDVKDAASGHAAAFISACILHSAYTFLAQLPILTLAGRKYYLPISVKDKQHS